MDKNFAVQPKGVPITILVPTHLDVFINETYYLQNVATSPNVDLREVPMKRRNLWVEPKVVETRKLFTVDWKRPFSGSLDYSATMGEDQYFDRLGATITDTTITDATAFFKAVIPLGAKQASASSVSPDLIGNNRVVAYQRFDLDACDFEEQVLAFVDYHLNACNNCQGPMHPTAIPIDK